MSRIITAYQPAFMKVLTMVTDSKNFCLLLFEHVGGIAVPVLGSAVSFTDT